jgi:hypothetical protein
MMREDGHPAPPPDRDLASPIDQLVPVDYGDSLPQVDSCGPLGTARVKRKRYMAHGESPPDPGTYAKGCGWPAATAEAGTPPHRCAAERTVSIRRQCGPSVTAGGRLTRPG